MKKFKFKLQALLDHRQRMEDEKKKELAKANFVLTNEKDKLNDLGNIFKATQKELQKREKNKIKIADVLFYQSYLIQLQQLMNHQFRKIQEVMIVVDKKRRELVEAAKNKKVMERLKEKAYEKYVKEISMFEQKFIDEMAMNKFLREHELPIKQMEN